MKKRTLSVIFMIVGVVLFGISLVANNEDVSTLMFIIGPLVFIIATIALIVNLIKSKKQPVSEPQSTSQPNAQQVNNYYETSDDENINSNNLSIKALHCGGLNGVAQMPVILELDEENKKIYIHANSKHCTGVSEFTLDLDKIIAAGSDIDIQYKQKSGVGRAVAGGMMFGATGAVVGALTQKDKKVTTVYDEIYYKSESGTKVLKFRSCVTVKKERQFFDRINELVNLRNANPDGSIDL